MRFNGLDLNLLVALNAVLTELNVSRAAERVFLSQSAVSSALGRLREYFDDELVVPVGRKLVMTPLAESLVEPVRDLLLRLEATIAIRPRFDPATSQREFSLVVSDYVAIVFIPLLLRRVAALAPQVRIVLKVGSPVDQLERGEADLLFVPEQWVSAEHPSDVVMHDSYVCMACESNRRVKSALLLEDYLALGHVAIDQGGGHQQVFDGWFLRRFGVSRRVEVTTRLFSALPHLVAGTERLATVQRLLAAAHRHLPLRVLEPPMEIPPLVLTIQWHKYRSLDPGLAWLRGVALDTGRRLATNGLTPTA